MKVDREFFITFFFLGWWGDFFITSSDFMISLVFIIDGLWNRLIQDLIQDNLKMYSLKQKRQLKTCIKVIGCWNCKTYCLDQSMDEHNHTREFWLEALFSVGKYPFLDHFLLNFLFFFWGGCTNCFRANTYWYSFIYFEILTGAKKSDMGEKKWHERLTIRLMKVSVMFPYIIFLPHKGNFFIIHYNFCHFINN